MVTTEGVSWRVRAAQARHALSPAEWRRAGGMVGFIVLLHVVGFVLLFAAVGGHYHVHVMGLDAKGNPEPSVTSVPVLSPHVRALVYSAKFDCLYVGVEVSK